METLSCYIVALLIVILKDQEGPIKERNDDSWDILDK